MATPGQPIDAAQVLAARWRADDANPGVIHADLGPGHAPDVVIVDPYRDHDLSDAAAAAVAAHLVALHNAALPARPATETTP